MARLLDYAEGSPVTRRESYFTPGPLLTSALMARVLACNFQLLSSPGTRRAKPGDNGSSREPNWRRSFLLRLRLHLNWLFRNRSTDRECSVAKCARGFGLLPSMRGQDILSRSPNTLIFDRGFCSNAQQRSTERNSLRSLDKAFHAC